MFKTIKLNRIRKELTTLLDSLGFYDNKACRYYVDSEFDMDKRPYYTEAVRRIRTADPAATFLVFSDQPSKLELGQYGLMTEDVRLVPASIGIWESLYLMSRCTGAICANSSFSWFGAFGIRGTGPIFMPAVWSRLHASCPNPPWAESC